MSKISDIIFISSSITFNILVSIIYIAMKLDNPMLVQVSGVVVLSLMLPFAITLFGYLSEKKERKIIISHIFILFYLFLELSLDYILKIPFREIPAIHVPYIIAFYAAMVSMMSVSFHRSRKMGSLVIVAFGVLIMSLIYYLSPY